MSPLRDTKYSARSDIGIGARRATGKTNLILEINVKRL